jgi:hypothetical protein
MQFLAAFLISTFGGLVGWLAKRVGARIGLAAAFMISYLAILMALWVFLKATIIGLVLAVNNPWINMGFWLVWPSNAEAVIAACISAELAIFIYRVHRENVRALAYIT